MRKEIPAGVLDMLCIPGLRPEKVLKLHKELGVATIAELERAASAGQLKDIKGLGPALERKILQGIAIRNQGAGRRHLHRAAELLRSAEQELRNAYPRMGRIEPAGEFRRGCELVGALTASDASFAIVVALCHGEIFPVTGIKADRNSRDYPKCH
jgi:DNA polymerase (family 10)